ncbi:MAG: Flp pilus assembly complex ATPase component TadA [Phycisphaeraceae bacterium]|nr:Flp pilus assembly complex ATPase component TadA [Phycisphaeraceae bacterium]
MPPQGLKDLLDRMDALGKGSSSAPPPPDGSETTRDAAAAAPPPAEALHELWTPETGPDLQVLDLGQLLLDRRAVTGAQLNTARTVVSQTPGKTLADALVDLGVDEPSVQQAVSELANLPFEPLAPGQVELSKHLHKLGLDYCKTHGVIPLRMAGTRLVLGVTHPDNLAIVDEVRHRLGVSLKPVVVSRLGLAAVIDGFREEDGASNEVKVDEIIKGIEEDDVEVVANKEEDLDLEKAAGESPVIRYVNYLIFNAVKEGASDIHVEPQEKKLKIRYRVDGILFEMMNPPHHMHAAIISRLKVMANLDISERRLPQDGRIRAMVHGRKLDLRLSTLPTSQGEKAVMRILDTRSIQVKLEELGMGEDCLLIWRHPIDQPHGIVLVTGPTGSGKTTTLYASIGQMDRAGLNISTVEDPVEYHLSAINQVQVHDRIGMGFAAALRALLRQDPDVIMVGEIRDAETARIAIQASLTGHLVLSTLHTNDAPSSVTRLINIGVEPYLIGAAVNAVLAQRLVRKICQHCKQQVRPPDAIAEHLANHGIAIDQVWTGQGCDRCRRTGYSGRQGLYELLVLDDFLRDKIASSPNVTEFRRLCIERGMSTLREDGFKKVAQGITTVDEVLRVTESTI